MAVTAGDMGDAGYDEMITLRRARVPVPLCAAEPR